MRTLQSLTIAWRVVARILLEEQEIVRGLQRRLVAEHSISSTDLAAMLAGVTQRDVATLVLAKCQASERPPTREELRRLRQLERQARKPKEGAK